LINYRILQSSDKRAFEGYFNFNNRFIWHYEDSIDGKRVIVCFDEQLKSMEEKDYLSRIEKKLENYSMEGFYEKQSKFGTLALFTNLRVKNAEQIHSYYKSRVNIELMFDESTKKR